MNSNSYKQSKKSEHQNIIIFQSVIQNEDGDSTIFNNEPEANLPQSQDFSSLRIKYPGQGYSQRKRFIIISLVMLLVIVLLAVLVLRVQKTKHNATVPVTTQPIGKKDSKNQPLIQEKGSSTTLDKQIKEAALQKRPPTLAPPQKDIKPVPEIKPQEPKPAQQPSKIFTRQQSNKAVQPIQPKHQNDLQAQKVSLEKVNLPVEVPEITYSGHNPSYQHRHQDLTFDYPTLGIPVPGQKYNYSKVNYSDLPLFDQTFNQLFKPYNDTDCEFVRYGKIDDGGYVLCKNFFSRSHALLNIGVNGEDSFGCDVTSAHPMPNYQYDCTNGNTPFCFKNKGLNHFSKICIGQTTQKTQFHTFHSYQDILRSHNLTDKHITLKIDCEGGQYPGFKALPLKYLDLIDQIIIELHFDSIYPEDWGMLDVFRTLADKFVNVNYHNNNWGCFKSPSKQHRRLKSSALELTLVNRKLIKLKSESRSFAQHPLNQKNGRHVPYCQLEV